MKYMTCNYSDSKGKIVAMYVYDTPMETISEGNDKITPAAHIKHFRTRATEELIKEFGEGADERFTLTLSISEQKDISKSKDICKLITPPEGSKYWCPNTTNPQMTFFNNLIFDRERRRIKNEK